MLTRGARAETEAASLQANTDGNIPKLLDFIDGYLVLAIEQQIFYAPIAQLGLKSEYENDNDGADDLKVAGNVHVEELQGVGFFKIQKEYKVITIQQIGKDMTCLVYEDREDKKIRFMRTYFEETPDKGMTV